MAANSDSEVSEEYEVLDLSNINENWFRQLTKRTLGDISRQSALKQFGVGSGTGVLAGWLFVKVGKVAAATLGTTVLLIQVAQHQGYIQINWDRVRSSMRRAEREVHRTANRHYPGLVRNFRDFVQQNLFLAVGFGGGFLVGMAI
ncbi:FUN14 domain-containing protein 1-like [Babylonia areolata]|uniref:FUN14 domain-containing protein 1-like n=1 Tax=Babylonia areolata TaxID=304850 RepID=UPI003FD47FF1